MPHLMSKEDARADAFETVRGVELLGLRVVAIYYEAYALMSLCERPLAKRIDELTAHAPPSERGHNSHRIKIVLARLGLVRLPQQYVPTMYALKYKRAHHVRVEI